MQPSSVKEPGCTKPQPQSAQTSKTHIKCGDRIKKTNTEGIYVILYVFFPSKSAIFHEKLVFTAQISPELWILNR